jgi:hypothetical protein
MMMLNPVANLDGAQVTIVDTLGGNQKQGIDLCDDQKGSEMFVATWQAQPPAGEVVSCRATDFLSE